MNNESEAQEIAKRSANLGKRVQSGFFWAYAEYGTSLLLSFGSLVILARVLKPEDFGVFAVGTLFCSISILFRLGLGPSIIQRKGSVEGYVDVAWSANVVMSIIAALVLAASVPLVTTYILRTPGTMAVCWFLLMTVILDSLTSPGMLLNQRYMENRKLFMVAVMQPLFRYGVSIGLALYLHNYWALAIGFFCGSLAQSLTSHLVAPHPIRFKLSKAIFLELFAFSGWLQLNNLVRWLSRYIDSAIVASSFGTQTLGLYNRARTLAEIPENFQQVLALRILFPMFSSVQTQPERSANLMKHAYALVLLTSVPLVSLTWNFGDQIIDLVLGSKWKGISGTLFILMTALAIQAVNIVATSALRGNGYPRDEFFLGATRVITTILTMLPFIAYFGLNGAAIAVLAGTSIASAMALLFVWRRLRIGVETWGFNILIAILAVLLAVWLTKICYPVMPENFLGLIAAAGFQMLILFGAMLPPALIFRIGPAQTLIEHAPLIMARLK